MTMKEIRAGINAFTLMEKEKQRTNLPLKESVILEAFHLINRTVSDELIRQWIKKNRPFLECEKKERRAFEKYVRSIEDRKRNEDAAEEARNGVGYTGEEDGARKEKKGE
jgi:hypothetical protein